MSQLTTSEEPISKFTDVGPTIWEWFFAHIHISSSDPVPKIRPSS